MCEAHISALRPQRRKLHRCVRRSLLWGHLSHDACCFAPFIGPQLPQTHLVCKVPANIVVGNLFGCSAMLSHSWAVCPMVFRPSAYRIAGCGSHFKNEGLPVHRAAIDPSIPRPMSTSPTPMSPRVQNGHCRVIAGLVAVSMASWRPVWGAAGPGHGLQGAVGVVWGGCVHLPGDTGFSGGGMNARCSV